MHKKAVINRISCCAWVVLCLILGLSFSPVATAEYKVVYSHSASHKNSQTFSANDDIWKVLQHEFALNHQAERPEVKEQIAWYMAHRKYLRAAANNARPYMYYIITQVQKRGLPLEFSLLPFNESAYDPFAYSTSGASGLWQMMPATATDFGLKQNWWYDGRRDVIASTNAALDYLVYLQNFFGGNWMFTVAAYHAGQGTVLNALKKNAANGEATDFWSLPLGKQTQLYIPKLLALSEMIAHPEKYPLDLPPIPNKPYLTEVDVGSQIDLAKAARLCGLSLSELKNLNPGFNRWATSPDGPYRLVVPIQNEAALREGLALLPQGNRVTWERYDVKSGDTLNKIALKYNTTMAVLQQVNKLDTTMIRVGDIIFIPNTVSHVQIHEASSASAALSTKSADAVSLEEGALVTRHGTMTHAENTDAVAIYTVRQGDTLSSIAQTLNIPWQTLREYNHLNDNVLKVGQRLNIPPLMTIHASVEKTKTQQVRYVVQKNDSLTKIALRFGVTVKDIQRWNPSLLSRTVLQPKERLVIYQPLAD